MSRLPLRPVLAVACLVGVAAAAAPGIASQVRADPPVQAAALSAPVDSATAAGTSAGTSTAAGLPPARHVFVINLENKGYATTFGANSPATYLTKTLRPKGALLTQYYGTAHNSLPNYIGQISGQGPNPVTQSDCQTFSDFVGGATVSPGQAVGQGCVYPASVKTLPDQLLNHGLTWKGYMDGMARGGDGRLCQHPAIGAVDETQRAEVGNQYAVRHNPFVYFHSIIDSPECAKRDVPLFHLKTDLAKISTTANYSLITPDLCNDGHDSPCVDGRPGGLVTADKFLRDVVPGILASPAFKRDGILVVTFDESDSPQEDASACCGEGPGPNSPMPGITGLGGGRIGAVVLSPFVTPGTTSTTPYNHYGLLATIEDLFSLPRLGYAATVPARFGKDVFRTTS